MKKSKSVTKDLICGMTEDEEHLIARLVRSETVFGLACKKRNFDHATKFISRLNPFSERGPHRERPVDAKGEMTPVQIAMKTIAQTRCQL